MQQKNLSIEGTSAKTPGSGGILLSAGETVDKSGKIREDAPARRTSLRAAQRRGAPDRIARSALQTLLAPISSLYFPPAPKPAAAGQRAACATAGKGRPDAICAPGQTQGAAASAKQIAAAPFCWDKFQIRPAIVLLGSRQDPEKPVAGLRACAAERR